MSFFRYTWTWFRGLFSSVGSSHPPSEPTLITEGVEEDEPLVEDFFPEAELTFPDDFPLEDFACEDGTPVPPEYHANAAKLANNLYILTQEIGKDVEVVDGFRTEEYNKSIQGNKNSTHLTCLGADIKVKGMGRVRLVKKIKELIQEEKLEKGGVAVYPDCVHYDVRGRNFSWVGKRKRK